jgi:hypothetical protein
MGESRKWPWWADHPTKRVSDDEALGVLVLLHQHRTDEIPSRYSGRNQRSISCPE